MVIFLAKPQSRKMYLADLADPQITEIEKSNAMKSTTDLYYYESCIALL